MKYEAEVPFGGDYIYVDIDFEVEWVDNSFSYSYGSIDGVYDPGSGWEIVGESWDKTLFTSSENKAIGEWIGANIDEVYEHLIKRKNDYP